jgi:type VI secretion system protein ImpJ
MASQKVNPIAWTEGMFLRPQHLQQHDLYVQDRLTDHLRTVDPFHWGIRELVIDTEALSDHRIEVVRLDAVLRDGTVLRVPGNAVIESREFDPAVQSVDVHVGIRRLDLNEANSAPIDNGARDVRYKVRSQSVPDLNRGGSEASVDVLVPNVRMFLTGEELELETHETLHIARVDAVGDLKQPFALAREYAPPLLTLQAFAPLDEEVGSILSQLAAKVRVVAGRTATIAVADLPRMYMRYTLSRMTPVLRHLLSTGSTHPFTLYTALIETAGGLAAFALDEVPEFRPYSHEDLYPCFHELLTFIDRHLEEVLPMRFKELRMEYDRAEGKQYYVTNDLSVELADPRNVFFVGIKAPIDSKELHALVKESGKAGAAKEMWTLRQFSQDGLRIDPLPAAPTDIAAPTGFEWFRVEAASNDRSWSIVRQEFTFALSLSKLESADVRLYVVSREA